LIDFKDFLLVEGSYFENLKKDDSRVGKLRETRGVKADRTFSRFCYILKELCRLPPSTSIFYVLRILFFAACHKREWQFLWIRRD